MCDHLSSQTGEPCIFAQHGASDVYTSDGKRYCGFHGPRRSYNILTNKRRRKDPDSPKLFSDALNLIRKTTYNSLDLSDGVIEDHCVIGFPNYVKNFHMQNCIARGNIDISFTKSPQNIHISIEQSPDLKVAFSSNTDATETFTIDNSSIGEFTLSINFIKRLTIGESKCNGRFRLLKHASHVHIANSRFQSMLFPANSELSRVTIKSSSFEKELDIQYSRISDNLFVDNTTFGRIDLRNTLPMRDFRFSDCRVGGNFLFSTSSSIGSENAREVYADITLEKCTINGETDFSNRKFQRALHFVDCEFLRAPSLFDTTVHQNTRFDGCTFKDKRGDSAEKYRSLRHSMNAIRARDQEGIFFSLEMQSRENSEQLDQWTLILSKMYRVFSNYGQSAIRPFLWIAVTHIIFFLLYVSLTDTCIQHDLLPDFTFQQSFSPFFVWKECNICEYSQHKTTVKILATTQSIFVIIFLSLGLLAIRWRFKRD